MRSMLRTAICATLICGTSVFVRAAEPAATKTSQADEKPSAAAQARLLAALQVTAEALRSRSLELAELPRFEELLAAAEAYWQDPSVPLDRRAKWCGLAKARLHEGATILRRQGSAAAQAAQRPTSVRPRTATLAQVVPQGGVPPAPTGAANAAADEAQKLIDLIQGVVRPDTWDANGGQGVIKYWSLGHGLVIYNTGDVHERIGGSMGFLRQ